MNNQDQLQKDRELLERFEIDNHPAFDHCGAGGVKELLDAKERLVRAEERERAVEILKKYYCCCGQKMSAGVIVEEILTPKE